MMEPRLFSRWMLKFWSKNHEPRASLSVFRGKKNTIAAASTVFSTAETDDGGPRERLASVFEIVSTTDTVNGQD